MTIETRHPIDSINLRVQNNISIYLGTIYHGYLQSLILLQGIHKVYRIDARQVVVHVEQHSSFYRVVHTRPVGDFAHRICSEATMLQAS